LQPQPLPYTLTVQAETGGGVDTSVNGSYAAGDVVTIAAAADANYSFSGWTSDNGGTFADASSAVTTFTMPAADVTVTAKFTSVAVKTPQSKGPPGTSRFTGPTEPMEPMEPIKPTEPTKPAQPAPTTPTEQANPDTGNNHDSMLCMVVLCVLFTMTGLLILDKRRNK